jgi:dephospho-CoA kinase
MLVVGLTGNYGMGKSSVTSMFRELGAVTLDSDRIVARLLRQETVIGQIMGFIGVGAVNPDGSLNKAVVAEKVFRNRPARKKLEALLHPLVLEYVEAAAKKIRNRNKIVIVEVPLLFEGKFQKRFDRTITVYTSRKTALARLRREGITRKDALARLEVQMDIREKKRLADYVIDNGGTRKQTEMQAREVMKALREENSVKVSMGRRRS